MPVFTASQIVRSDINTCWDFFSDPANLTLITPPEMNFVIRFPNPVPKMYEGMIIQYSVSPLFNIPMEWITEISHIAEPFYFVDNQIKGPYALWHHQHFFEEVQDGVKISDIVTYSLPFGILGRAIAGNFVKRKVEGIFEHRRRAIEKVMSYE